MRGAIHDIYVDRRTAPTHDDEGHVVQAEPDPETTPIKGRAINQTVRELTPGSEVALRYVTVVKVPKGTDVLATDGIRVDKAGPILDGAYRITSMKQMLQTITLSVERVKVG